MFYSKLHLCRNWGWCYQECVIKRCKDFQLSQSLMNNKKTLSKSKQVLIIKWIQMLYSLRNVSLLALMSIALYFLYEFKKCIHNIQIIYNKGYCKTNRKYSGQPAKK